MNRRGVPTWVVGALGGAVALGAIYLVGAAAQLLTAGPGA